MWIITNGNKYYGGIVRQTTGLFKDEINMVRKGRAKGLTNIPMLPGPLVPLDDGSE